MGNVPTIFVEELKVAYEHALGAQTFAEQTLGIHSSLEWHLGFERAELIARHLLDDIDGIDPAFRYAVHASGWIP